MARKQMICRVWISLWFSQKSCTKALTKSDTGDHKPSMSTNDEEVLTTQYEENKPLEVVEPATTMEKLAELKFF